MAIEMRHKWIFPARFRAGGYGWKSSRLACQRLREAVSEIKKVAKKEPVVGADGAVRLMEKTLAGAGVCRQFQRRPGFRGKQNTG
jgi:hypothetical protein